MTVELDYMEYADSAAAQVAYVSDGYTSDLLTGGTPSVDSEYPGGGYDASKACDDNVGGTLWQTDDAVFPHWWKYDFGVGVTKIITKLRTKPYYTADSGMLKDFTLQGSNNDSDWTDIYSGQVANADDWDDFTFTNITAYRYYRIYITTTWNATYPNYAGAWEFEMMENTLQCYSESTIKQQGSYSLKVVAAQTGSLNDTLTNTLGAGIDLSNQNTLKFDIRASRTGSNIKIGIHDSGGTTTEITPNITVADVFQTVTWDISSVSNANKDDIDSIIITIVNADAANTFYLDDMYAEIVGGIMTIRTKYWGDI